VAQDSALRLSSDAQQPGRPGQRGCDRRKAASERIALAGDALLQAPALQRQLNQARLHGLQPS